MDKQIMVQYLKERRVIYPDSGGHQRVLFMDNCGGHNESPEQKYALQQLHQVFGSSPIIQHICDSLVTHGTYKRSSRCGQRSRSWRNFAWLSSVLDGMVRDRTTSCSTMARSGWRLARVPIFSWAADYYQQPPDTLWRDTSTRRSRSGRRNCSR